ncbi:MAG TPA: cyclic nucleotide-binding domain-containing protein [Gammaproteobacteria bacterium]
MVDKKLLSNLVPINALSGEHVERLASVAAQETLPAGDVLFRQGEADRRTIYLLDGEVALGTGSNVMKTLKGGSDATRHPLAPFQPRQVTATAKTGIAFLRFQSDMLDTMLTWHESSGYVVDDISDHDEDEEDENDWMTKILSREAFFRIPPANIQAMFMRMETVSCRAGQTVIRQGEEGDYYYIIKRGHCAVTRKTRAHPQGVKLATLAVGDSFGEEALLSSDKRNATVTMLSDGELVRLSKDDFMKLLKEPLLNWVDLKTAQEMIAKGAQWLDVRLPAEYEQRRIDGSLNMPFHSLRLKAKTLTRGSRFVVCCDTGSRSSAAAFLLNERGFDAFVLKGGLNANPALVPNGG